jgi:hypothetical protein
MKARELTVILSAVVVLALAGCAHHRRPSAPVPLSSGDRARLAELRAQIADPIAEIAAIIARNPNLEPIGSLGGVALCFTGRPDALTIRAAISSDIEFPDEIVIGDGEGCVLDPPGISCECPCPE